MLCSVRTKGDTGSVRLRGVGGPRVRYFAVLALSTLSVALMSCSTTNLPPIEVGDKSFQIEKDEQELWRNAEQLERRIEMSRIGYSDPQLEAYLSSVTERLPAGGIHIAGVRPRVKVILHPLLNAYALPNGAIYLHSGLLVRIQNEAQLAAILGHELTHVSRRHALKEMRSAQNRATFLRILQTTLAVTGLIGVAQLTGDIGALWALAAVRGYSRELETEADEAGLQAVVEAGYDPKEAPKVFEHLQRELDERKVAEPFFFGTHPRLQERIANYRKLLETQYADRAKEARRLTNAEEFLSRIGQALLDNAVLDLNIGRVKTAQASIEQHLIRQPHSPHAHYLLGDLHRRSGQGEQYTQRALAAYQEAARLDPSFAEAHRELGLLYRAQNRPEQARAELALYLALKPEAVDAPIVRGYLAELGPP